jgi:hypothetical protein
MRHLSRVLPGVALAALILCVAAVTATAAVRGDGHGKDDKDKGPGKAAPAAPAAPTAPQAAAATPPGPPATPPGQAKKTTPPPPAPTPPGQAKKAPAGASTTPGTTPTTGDAQPAPGQPAEPTPVPPATAPVIGETMGLKPAGGTVQVRLPNSSGYVSLAAAGSVPSGAVVDARRGTVLLRSAVDAAGRTQTATVRGAIFEVRQATDGKGMTDLVLRDGRPKDCPATGTGAMARAAMVHGRTTKAKAKAASAGLWARDRHGRFRTRGRNSVATVRGTRWVTHETCAGTLTRVMDGAVDVFDKHTHRTVRVRAGHTYLARRSG